MIVLTSAAYIDPEFSAEFGPLPPAFLPVGNRPLYAHQARHLPADERRVLTIPESFSPSPVDEAHLAALGIEVLRLPEKLSLGESIVFCVNLAGHPPDAPLRILHGDTLIEDLPGGDALDVVTLSEVDGAYDWAVWHDEGEPRLARLDAPHEPERTRIANGYFAFSDTGLLVRSILAASGSFVDGINRYDRQRPLRGVDVGHWFDLGHLHTYYRSRARITTQRAFNRLLIDGTVVRKSSRDRAKMQAEYDWFRSVPPDLRVHLPQMVRAIEGEWSGYELQYLYLPTLADLYVFARLPAFVWRQIFTACFRFLDACSRHQGPPPPGLDAFFTAKTRDRVSEFVRQRGIDPDAPRTVDGRDVPGITAVMKAVDAIVAAMPAAAAGSVMHGDFCFSNVLFDFRSQSIQVIDPRGRLPDGTPSVYGDRRYDLAKLAHSVLGLYDFIMAGYFRLDQAGSDTRLDIPVGPAIGEVQALFRRLVAERYGLSPRELTAMQVHLFLSMLPLHADDPARQDALLANALRLYATLD
ncbi:MAG: phosphotransferase [Chromatiales bacterium]|jgi:hypothetical protein|nr:phosphotransferase [Chromatiales bacterium]